ncbi:uncharacterized protein LOC134790150 isoform X2 [Cydia splendana]|uniref:uncharacterized protein LOC134790150 isoform X2 n=1 Tax=Cydia splendana TaxID=1100963 RepID=UPI0028F4B694
MFYTKNSVFDCFVCDCYICFCTMSSNNLIKSAGGMDQNDNNMCNKHAARCDKEHHRPSNLSKRELEDLYYSLLDSNLELKRTINAQNEKNRILSTKVQRMTSLTKTYTGRDCCAAAKAVISEQRAGIADLTKANEALADRIRKLSMQLCTARQFLKQNHGNRSYKSFSNTHNSLKINSSMSLQNKSSVAEQDPPSTRTAETNTLVNDQEKVEKKDAETVCSVIKCRSIEEQFKQKIEELEEVSRLQSAVMRARSEQSLRNKDSLELVRGHISEAEKAELETQLSIEKRKVAELQMQVKAAELSEQVAKTVENHLSTTYPREEKQLRQTSPERCSACSNMIIGETSPRPVPTITLTKTPNELTVPDDKLSKSDDSGYADHRQETDTEEKNNKTNLELMKRIEEIQAQLDALQLAKPVPTTTSTKTPNELTVPDDKLSKSDDSGYADHRQETDTDEKNNKTNLELMKRIKKIQAQLDSLHLAKPAPTTTSTKTPNELTVTDDKLFKSYDSGYADHRQETDSDEKNNKTNLELMKRIKEIKAQLDALRLAKAEKDNAEQESSFYSKSIDYNYKSDDEQRIKDKNISAKPTRISISEREAIVIKLPSEPESTVEVTFDNERKTDTIQNKEKLNATIETDTTTKDNEYPYREIYVRNDSNSDKSNETQVNNSHQQVVEICPVECECPDDNNDQFVNNNCPVKCECPDDNTDQVVEKNCCRDGLETNTLTERNETKSPENCLSPMVNKDQLLNYPKKIEQGDNLQKEVVIVKPKPVNYHDKSKTKIPPIDEQDSSVKYSSIVRTPKKYDDNYQQIPGPIPPISDSATKRRFSLTKRKAKPAKDQGKDDRNKKVNKKDKKALKHDQKDVNVARKVEPNETIGYNGTGELKSQEYENEKLPLDVTPKNNDIRRIYEYDFCQHHVTFCTCPEKSGPSLSLFRSCSGSQILATLHKDSRFRRCSCSERTTHNCSILRAPIGSSTPKAERPPLMSPHTYTIDKSRDSRANSPANTEHEISVMTDLPSENDDLSNRLSPGEHRTVSTSTSTKATPREGYTLSEGEVPVYQERRTSKSLGEVRRNDYAKEDSSFGEQRSPTQKMEAMLQVISQELARCRSLLQTQRPQEQKKAVTVDPVSLVLRKTEGKSQFDGTVAPSCLFTMHVVTVVLSDEAILRSRDTNLVLKWVFERKTTMTPLSKGRVTYFDFSTQYEFQLTKEMEEYLKNEDMLIVICEMDSAKEPFATCALPLRQVILNVNRRVDMSLPLRAGPCLKEKPTGLQVNDDVGVLDVWCMLVCK